jgi:acetyl-CoA carboxylase biotin carboxyl carrier protein
MRLQDVDKKKGD